MNQKHDSPTASPHGIRSASRCLATGGSPTLWRSLVHGAALGLPSPGPAAGPSRLDGSFPSTSTSTSHPGRSRTEGFGRAALVEAVQCLGRIRGAGHLWRNTKALYSLLPLDCHDQPHPATTRCFGRSPPDPTPAATERLVLARGGSQTRRIGQLRYHRRPGDSRWSAFDGFYRYFPAWRLGDRLAPTPAQSPRRGAAVAGILAGKRPASLCSIRQRSTLQRASAIRQHLGPRGPLVPAVGRDASFRPSQRNRLPSGYRKLQRPLAQQGLVAISTFLAVLPEAPFAPIPRRSKATPCRPHRGFASKTALSPTLESQLAKTAAGNSHLPASHRRPRTRQHPGPLLPSQSQLGASAGPGRSGFEPTGHPLLHAPSSGTQRSTVAPRSGLCLSSSAFQGVT